MNEREKDVLAAEKVLGWTRHRDTDLGTWWTLPLDTTFATAKQMGAPYYYRNDVPAFGGNSTAAQMLEDAIERLGMTYPKHYVDALATILDITAKDMAEHSAYVAWQIVRATPAQRRDAALRAVGCSLE